MPSFWMIEHVDFLEHLMREENLSRQEIATKMSRQFRQRVTPAQVAKLLSRMRTPVDPFFRNVPYSKRGARFAGP